jgi:hypothetical protein
MNRSIQGLKFTKNGGARPVITVVPIAPNIDLSDGSEIMTAVPGAVSPTGLSEVDSLNLLHYNLTIPAIFLEPGYDSIVDSTLTIEGNLENYGSINISQDSTAKIMYLLNPGLSGLLEVGSPPF